VLAWIVVRQDAGGGISSVDFFPKTQPFGPMFIGFRRVAKVGVFLGRFKDQGLDIKGIERFLCGIPGFDAWLASSSHEAQFDPSLPLQGFDLGYVLQLGG